MTSLSRRRFLAGSVSTLAFVAGCSGGNQNATGQTETATETSRAGAIATSEASVSCEGSTATHRVAVTTRGAMIMAADQNTVETLRADLEELETETRQEGTVRLQSVQRGGTERVAIEIDRKITTPETLRSAFGDREGVVAIREGQSYATVETVATQLRQYLTDSETLSPENVDVTIVTPAPPAPFTVVGLLSGVKDDSVLDAADSIAVRVSTEGGKRDLVTGAAVERAQVQSEPSPGVQFRLTTTGQTQFRDGLEAVGALKAGSRHSIRLYFDGEQVFDGQISRGLAANIKSGEWNGQFLAGTASPEEARRLAEAMNLLTFDVPVELQIQQC